MLLAFIKELAAYEKMLEEVVADEATLEEWLFDRQKAEAIFIEEAGKEAGFALFFHNFSTFLGRAGIYLEDLFVKPEYRGKGYGKALLEKLADIAVQRGCGRLEWWCLDRNQPSIDFYLSMGAEPMSDWTVYRIDGSTLKNVRRIFVINMTNKKQDNIQMKNKARLIRTAAGQEPADLVLKNARYVNVFSNEILSGDLAITDGLIAGIGSYHGRKEIDLSGSIVLPGLMDAHIHLESALTMPSEFARAVLPHGTTAVFTDPHEIANVLGTDGIEYMLEATEGLPLDVYFMLPSCVPAAPEDESGARLQAAALAPFYAHPRVKGLAEMMNAYGVVSCDPEILQKLSDCKAYHARTDGHAPGISGKALQAYAAAGIASDHECSTFEEALEKLRSGQYIMIREGTAARNLKALRPLLIEKYIDRILICTDDRHPNDLEEKGHIDYILKQAIAAGTDPCLAVKAATYNTARYFGYRQHGAIAPGYAADLTIIDNFKDFTIQRVYKNGKIVADYGRAIDFPEPVIQDTLSEKAHHTFHVRKMEPEDFIPDRPLAVIGMQNGEITTTDEGTAASADPEQDRLEIAVIERHHNTNHIGLGYMKGYGLKSGAVATSIAHDAHNIIVIGADPKAMADAVNRVIAINGGIVVMDQEKICGEVPLAIAGIMSDEPLKTVSRRLSACKRSARQLGVNPGIDPFMTLSFMALTVIPTLRITTHGIYDVQKQKYLSIFRK